MLCQKGFPQSSARPKTPALEEGRLLPLQQSCNALPGTWALNGIGMGALDIPRLLLALLGLPENLLTHWRAGTSHACLACESKGCAVESGGCCGTPLTPLQPAGLSWGS